jgi:hypothetical protein
VPLTRISNNGHAAYFAFVTWLTSGYGDLVPSRVITRLAAIVIGFIGMLLIGLVAAIGVHALQKARSDDPNDAGAAPGVERRRRLGDVVAHSVGRMAECRWQCQLVLVSYRQMLDE